MTNEWYGFEWIMLDDEGKCRRMSYRSKEMRMKTRVKGEQRFDEPKVEAERLSERDAEGSSRSIFLSASSLRSPLRTFLGSLWTGENLLKKTIHQDKLLLAENHNEMRK